MTRPTARTRRHQLLARSALAGLGVAVAIGASPALAQVTGVGTITSTDSNSGPVGVVSGSGATDITTGASRSIVNWTSLSVTPTEALNFYFNNRSDIVLNRVAGSASIDGILNGCLATCGTTGGNIWILSAGGVVIGGNAQISTGGFLASTGGLTDTDFLDGDMNFAFTGAANGSTISVASGAQITTNGGTLALIAPVVTTAAGSTLTGSGGGDVVYGSAQNYNVTFAPTGADDLDLISFQVPAQTDGAGGTPGLTLNGTTTANQVFAAVVSKSSVATSILLGGAITATAASGENGDIVLSAGSGFTNGVADTPMGFDGSITQNTTSTLTADNITLRASDDIAVDEITATGRVWLDSQWGGISQTGAITANVLRAEAGGDVILTNTGNDFNFLTYIEAQGLTGIDIVDADGFVIDSYIYHFGGGTRTASLTALTGSISATGSGVINVGTLNVSAAGGSIDLGSAANNTINLGTITAGAGDFSYRSLLDVNLAGVITASNVTLNSSAGAITESGGGAILASSLTASASTGISLSNANNDVSTIAGLSNSGSGDVVYGQADGFQITGAVTAVGQGLSLSSTNGSITQTATGIITTDLLNASAGDDLILDQANVVGGVGNLMAGGGAGDDLVFNSTVGFGISGTVGGDDVTLTSGGSIGQGATSRVIANLLTLDAAGGIDLGNFSFGTGNDIDALGLVTAGGAVSIGAISAIDLTADIDTNGGNLSLISRLGISQSGGVLRVNTLSGQVFTGTFTLNQANEVTALGHIFADGAGGFTFRNTGDVILNGLMQASGDTISLTSDTGAVVQNGPGITAGALSVSAQTGISLDRSNGFGALTALTTAAGDITFRNFGGFDLAGAVSGDRVSLTSTAGAITQSGGSITADFLTASAGGALTLGQTNAVATLGVLTAGGTGDITFVNSGDLELTGDITSGSGGGVSITSTGGAIDQALGAITADWLKLNAATTITQASGATLTSTALSLTSGGNVSLGEANSFTAIYDLAVGGDLTLRNAGSIDMGPTLSGFYNSGGALTLTSDTGSITTTGAGVVTSRLTASAAGSITLDGTIASLGDVTAGGNILLNTYTTAMDLTGDVTGSGVSLYADGAVTQSGGKIDASRLNVITNGAISLTGANEIDVVGRLETDQVLSGTGADITLRNVGNIVLDYMVGAPGATVTLTSDTGAITQTGFGTLTANRLVASAAGNITLYDGVNNVATIGGLASVSGDIVYRDVDSFDLQGDITANSAFRGVMLVAAGSGTITQTSGVLDVGYFRGVTGGSITLGGANQIRRLISTLIGNGALTLNTTTGLSVDGTVSANTVSLTSAGAITQANNAQIWTTTLNASAVTGINLAYSGFGANNIGNLGVISNTTSGGITIANSYPFMNLTGNITAAGQAVSLSNAMAGITQTGGIVTADTLSLSATGGISVTGNNLVGSLGAVTAGGNFAFTNVGDIDLTGNVDVGANTVSLISTIGHIFQPGGIITANVLNLSAGGSGGISLNRANAVTSLGAVTSNGHILFRNAGDVVVGGDIIANGFDVTLRSNSGSITQTAGNDITSNSLQVIAQTGATLTNAGNAINELAWVDVSSGGFAFSQTGGFQIGGPVLASGQTVSLTSLSGAITQNSGSVLQARTLNASAAGTLTLNQANNVTNLGVISTGGSFLFRDVDGFNLTGNVTAASQVVMLAQSGSIEQTGGIITADDINAMASVDILLGGANQINTISALSASRNLLYRQVGDLSVPTISASGTVSLYSTTGDITQTGTITADTLVLGAGDDIILGQNFITKLGQIDAGGDFTAADANGLSVGALGLTGNITVGGAMTLVNPGAIFQTSSTAIIAGSLFIDTDGALSATGANSISGNTRLSATGVAFNAVGDLTLQVNVTGFATIVSDGAVEIGGVGASTGDTLSIEAANGISQTQTLTFTNFGNLTNTTAGGIDLTNSSWLNLTGAINAANQYVALNVVTGGILQMSGSTITAQRLGMTTTQGALLGEMNNVAELGDVNVGTHNLLFRTLGDLLIDGDVTSALSVNLTSATGSIGQSAGSDITAGTLYVMAETGISLTNAGNDVGMLGTMINLGSSGGIAYAQTDGFQIDSVVRALNQTVSLTSIAGGISETGTVFAQIEAGTLNISAGGAVTLHRGNDVNNLGVVSAVGGFTFNDTDGFNLTGNVTGGGAVVLDAQAGSIVQTGGVITATSIDAAAAGNLDLGSANVVGAVTALSAGGDILYRQVGNLSVPAITASGSLSLYSTTGSISQTGALSAATLNLGAATGILLGNGGNDIGALGNLSNAPSGNITFLNVDGFDLTGAITAGGSQFVSLSALSGGITQQAGGSITAQALSVVAWDGATLGGDNDVDALGVIIGGPSFVFNDIDDVDISGALNAQAADLTAGGAITQSTGSLNVGTLSLTAASVALDGSNTITMLGDVDVTGNMSLSDVDGITLDGVQAVDGTLALTAGTFVTQQGGGLEVGRLEIDAGTGVAINLTANDIDTLGDITSTSGSISIIKNAFGPLVIDGDISAAASGQTIYINGFASGITMTAAGSLTAGANIDLVAGGNLVLGDINAGGTLNILAAGSSVSSLAAPTIVAARLTGTATAGSFILTGANIDIDQIGNIEVGNTFSITGNNGPLELAGVITAQTVSLGTTGALTQLGGNVDTTTGSFSAGGALTMTTLNSVDTVSLNGASITYNGSGSFAANVVTSTGAVSLTSSGKITQTALTGRIVADSLTASAATGLEFFGGQNDIRLLAGLSSTSGGVTYRDMGGFQITGNIDAAGQTVELVSDGTGADGTDVTQSGGVITANRLQGTSAGDLLFASANVVGQLGYLNAGGNIRYRGAASFTLQDNVNASGGLILNSDTGSIQQFGGSIIANGFAGTAAQGISLSRVNDVNFLGAVDSGAGDFNFRDDNSFDIAGLITSDTSIMLQAGGSINQTSGSIVTGSLSIFTNGAAFLNGAGNDIDNLGLSTVMNGMLFIDIDGFTINDRIFSTALVSLGATTGDILEVAGGYVSSQGLSVYASAGEVDFSGDNVIGTIGDLVADDDLTFHEVDGFTMSGTITGDAIKLTVAGGGINQTGGVITGDSLQVSAVTGISLAQAGNDVDTVLGLSTSSGGITLADADDLRIDGSVTATGQGVAFYVGGDLTQSFTGVITAGMVYGTAGGDFALSDAINTFGQLGTINADRIAINTTGGLNLTSDLTATSGVELKADNFITQSTGAAITGTTLRAQADGDIILDQANDLDSITLLYSDLGDITYNDVDGFSLDGGGYSDFWSSGVFILTAGGTGDITQTGAALRAGTLLVNAGGNVTLDLDNRIDLLGDSSAGGSLFKVVNLGNLTIAGDISVAGATGSVELISQTGEVEQTSGEIDAYKVGGASAGDFILTDFTGVLGDITTTAGDIDISNAGDIVLFGTLHTDNADNVTLNSTGGSIFHGSGRVETGTLTLEAAIGIALDGAQGNDIERLGTVSTYSNFAFRNDDSFELTGDIDVTMIGGGVVLTSDTGAITQTDGVITAYGLNLRAVTGLDLTSANMVSQLSLTNSGVGDVYVFNGRTITVGTASNLGGVLEIGATAGDILATGGIEAATIRLISAAGIEVAGLEATGDILVDATNGDAVVGAIVVGDDATVQAVNGSARVGSALLLGSADNEANGQNLIIAAGSGDAVLGAEDEASITAGADLFRVSGVGGVFVSSVSGNASAFLDSTNTRVSLTATNGDAAYVVAAGDLLAGNVSGLNVSLKAANGLVDANSVTVGGGDYTLYGQDFSAGAFGFTGAARDIAVTDTSGDLTITANLLAQRDLTIAVLSGDLIGVGPAGVGAGVGGSGDLSVEAQNIVIDAIGATGDVTLDVGATGDVDVGVLFVGADYNLTGGSFSAGALSPIGPMAGTWTLVDGGGFNFSGLTLTYNGDIDISAGDDITGGNVQSINGSVTIYGPSAIDIQNLYAATDITVTTTGDLTLDSATAYGGDISVTGGDSLTVEGFLDAAGDVTARATGGTADVAAATSGGSIIVATTGGDAILGAASLTGATGDLTVFADGGGDVIFGVLDYSTVSTDNVFSRAAGSTGTVTLASITGDVTANLWSSARIDMVQAYLDAEVSTETGDLDIGQIVSAGGEIYAEAVDGDLTVGEAFASTGFLGLYSGGDLTILDSAFGDAGVEIETAGLLDASLASAITSGGDMSLTGGSVQVTDVAAEGDLSIAAVGTGGDVYVEFAETEGLLIIGALDGAATLRAAEVADGIQLFAFGDVTLGADSRSLITSDNRATITVGGCGCGPGDITVVSQDGDVRVNLNAVTGVFDAIGAGINGDVDVTLMTGNLTIADLAGYNITVDVQAGTLETGYGDPSTYGVFLSGGNYNVTANSFLGNALTPNLPFATMNDYVVVQRLGALDMTGMSVTAQGEILINVRNGALTGDAQLTADGNISVSARGIAVDTVDAGGDVTLNAATDNINVATGVTVDGDYTLTGGNFLGATLSPLGLKAGDLLITDTVGDFDYSAVSLSYGGDITLFTQVGSIIGGDITSATGDIYLQGQNGVLVEDLSAVNGQVDAYAYGAAGVLVTSATANDRINIYTIGGGARLGAAALLGTGSNALSLNASTTGAAVLGAANPGAITGLHTFTSAGSTTEASVQATSGTATVNLYSAEGPLRVSGGGDVAVAVLDGDLELASAYSANGRIDVDGPNGQLTIGALYALTDVDITGVDVALNDATIGGDLTVDATGDIAFDGPAGSLLGRVKVTGDVTLVAAGGVSQDSDAGILASSLTLNAGDGASLLGVNQITELLDITVASGGFSYRGVASAGYYISGTINAAGQTVELRADNGPIGETAGGRIIAQRLTGSAGGHVTLMRDNEIAELGDFEAGGGSILALNVDGHLTIDGTVGAFGLAIHADGMTIASTGQVLASGPGDAIVLASNGTFTNNSGADALLATGGRWLIYTQAYNDPTGSTAADNYGGLDGKSYYGTSYDVSTLSFSGPINAGNRFVHAYQPILTVTPNSLTTTYNGQIPTLTALLTGLVNGDLAADAWSGSPLISGATSKNVGTYGLIASLGTLLSDMNYGFAFGTGSLTIDPKVISGTVVADDKTYDGADDATGSIILTGVVTGDDLTASATYSFDDRNAGVGKTVTANGAALGGVDAGNYVLDPLATTIADILRKVLTGTVIADNKTYDGSGAATGSVTLGGVVAGDTVSAVGGTYAFADKNAGAGKTVTASGVGLTGADAANYDLGPLATAVADILRKSITGALTADDKTYDGGLTTTGSIGLTGVIAGDTVDASGTYAFGDKTAGAGKTVTASGVTLSGADADNYDLTAVATSIADILRKALTGAVVADDKTYDGGAGATGSITLDGLVAGDTVQADGTLTFADRNAGVDKVVTASGVVLSGADAANYDLGPIAAAVADILRRQLTGTLTADGKTYDGTTTAAGSIALAGIVAGDTVGATGTFAFADKNAGAGKAVTATTTALTGADAGNYVLDPVAAAVADILRKAITASLIIDDKTYDGTTTGTGSVTLAGVIAGDTVGAGGTYSFADANAGADKTVTVSGVTLNGADAGNYTLTGVPGTSIADILRRQVTVTADDRFKLFGQIDPALTYTVTSGSVVVGDSFTGFIARVAGEMYGTYAIGQGDLALSQNYVLTFIPGEFEVRVLPSGGQDGSAALKYLRKPASWTLNWDPSANLTGDGEPICIDPICPGDVGENDAADESLVQTASLAGWRRFLPGAMFGVKVSVD